MKRGEKNILLGILILVLASGIFQYLKQPAATDSDPGIPFYTDASADLVKQGAAIYHEQGCKQCHSLWSVRNMLESVPAPALDGIGSLRSRDWFFEYLSAANPQQILPSRLKAEYRHPSYANLPEADRLVLASYLASLKVKDWYLKETMKAEYEKLTGKEYQP